MPHRRADRVKQVHIYSDAGAALEAVGTDD